MFLQVQATRASEYQYQYPRASSSTLPVICTALTDTLFQHLEASSISTAKSLPSIGSALINLAAIEPLALVFLLVDWYLKTGPSKSLRWAFVPGFSGFSALS